MCTSRALSERIQEPSSGIQIPQAESGVGSMSDTGSHMDAEMKAATSSVDREIREGRRDASGFAYAGSQMQVALYVNERREELNEAIVRELSELAGAQLTWVSPLRAERYVEYKNGAALNALDLYRHRDALRSFWPSGGPVWDGLAQVRLGDGRQGVLLIEGKSYPDELRGSGSAATAEASIDLIARSLAETRRWLKVENVFAEAWLGELYQSANRLAYLYFLRERLGIPAWLIHLLFVDDPRSPTSEQTWQPALQAVERELGLADRVDGYAHVYLPGLERPERI